MTSPHLYALAQQEAERAVRRKQRGAGLHPADPVRDEPSRRGVATVLRVHLATALIRAGEALGGTHHDGETDAAGAA